MNIALNFSGYNRLVVQEIDTDDKVIGTLQAISIDPDTGDEVIDKQETNMGFPLPNDYFSLTQQQIDDFRNPPQTL
jgi:hypothetical protein